MTQVTALIPTFQRPFLLQRAVLSVLNQTYSDIQVSVFDNASQDQTPDIMTTLKAKDSRVSYHRHPKNIGALKNFAFAFQSVQTPYFSILSDDDALVLDFYQEAVNILEANKDIMFVIFDTLKINENADLLAHTESTHKVHFFRDEGRWNPARVPHTWTAILFRREVAQLYLDMDDRFDIASDMRFLALAKAKYAYAYCSKVGAFFTRHENTISAARNRFDIVHHAVQVSRLLEIYYHPDIEQSYKAFARQSIIAMLKPNIHRMIKTSIETLKIAVKQICDGTPSQVLLNDIENAKNAGFNCTAFFLKYIYLNSGSRWLIRRLFSSYYLRLQRRRNEQMTALQHGVYRDLFEDLKSISKISPI